MHSWAVMAKIKWNYWKYYELTQLEIYLTELMNAKMSNPQLKYENCMDLIWNINIFLLCGRN